MSKDVATLNEQIARIKGWTVAENCERIGCKTTHVLTPEGFYKPLPDYTQPAMWAGLLVELGEEGDGTYVTYGQYHRKWWVVIVRLVGVQVRIGECNSLGLAVCRAYVAAHLPAEGELAAAQAANSVLKQSREDQWRVAQAYERRAEAAEAEVARLKAWTEGCEMERLGVDGKVCLTRGLRYAEEARHAD